MAKRISLLAKVLVIMLIVALGSIAVLVAVGSQGFSSLKDSTVQLSSNALQDKTQEHLQRIVADQARVSEGTLEGVKNLLDAQSAYIKDMHAHPEKYNYVPQKLDTSFVGSFSDPMPSTAPKDLGIAKLCNTCVVSLEYINVKAKPGIALSYDKQGNIVADKPEITKEIRTFSPTVTMLSASYKEHNDLVVWNYFGSANGVFYCYPGNGPLPPEYDPTQRDWYKAAVAKNGFAWTEPYIDVSGAGLMVTAAQPVYAEDGTFLGVVAADVTIQTINSQVINMDIGKTGYALLIDEKGTVIAKPEFKEGDARWDESFKNENLLTSENTELVAVAKKMTAGEKGSAIITLGGEKKFFVYAPVKGTGWSLVAVLPEKEALAGVEQVKASMNDRFSALAASIVVAIILLVIGVVAVSIVFAKRITKPIQDLTEAGNKVANGDLNVEIPQRDANDEITDLSATMGLLIGSVKYFKQQDAQKTAATPKKAEEKKPEQKAPEKAVVAVKKDDKKALEKTAAPAKKK